MIKPVNGHILIEPIAHESFMASQKEVYEEMGVVLDVADDLRNRFAGFDEPSYDRVSKGMKVYFDSWLAAKFPKDKEGEYFWLVKWEDVRAVEHAE